jgi:hypothetical protein
VEKVYLNTSNRYWQIYFLKSSYQFFRKSNSFIHLPLACCAQLLSGVSKQGKMLRTALVTKNVRWKNSRLFVTTGNDDKRITFSKQAELPVLPLPSLQDTAKRYLTAISSLTDLSKEEFKTEEKLAQIFVDRQGLPAQQALENFARPLATSWSEFLFQPIRFI